MPRDMHDTNPNTYVGRIADKCTFRRARRRGSAARSYQTMSSAATHTRGTPLPLSARALHDALGKFGIESRSYCKELWRSHGGNGIQYSTVDGWVKFFF